MRTAVECIAHFTVVHANCRATKTFAIKYVIATDFQLFNEVLLAIVFVALFACIEVGDNTAIRLTAYFTL